MNGSNIKLKDIKPLIMINNYELYYLIALSIIVIIILIISLYFIYRWYKNKNRFNLRQNNFQKLKQIKFDNSKKAAYDITKYGFIFKNDAPRNGEMYENLIQRLNQYKYKAKVENIDDETKSYFELYKDMIDV